MGQHANSLAAHRRNVKEQLAAQKKDATTESRTIPSVIKEWNRGPDTQENREMELGRSGWAASISEPYVPLGTPELQFKHPHILLRGVDETEEMRMRREQQEWEQRNRATLEEGLCVPLRRPKPKTHASHDLMQLAKQSSGAVRVCRAGGWFLDAVKLDQEPATSHRSQESHASSLDVDHSTPLRLKLPIPNFEKATKQAGSEENLSGNVRQGESTTQRGAHTAQGTPRGEHRPAPYIKLSGGPASDYTGKRFSRKPVRKLQVSNIVQHESSFEALQVVNLSPEVAMQGMLSNVARMLEAEAQPEGVEHFPITLMPTAGSQKRRMVKEKKYKEPTLSQCACMKAKCEHDHAVIHKLQEIGFAPPPPPPKSATKSNKTTVSPRVPHLKLHSVPLSTPDPDAVVAMACTRNAGSQSARHMGTPATPTSPRKNLTSRGSDGGHQSARSPLTVRMRYSAPHPHIYHHNEPRSREMALNDWESRFGDQKMVPSIAQLSPRGRANTAGIGNSSSARPRSEEGGTGSAAGRNETPVASSSALRGRMAERWLPPEPPKIRVDGDADRVTPEPVLTDPGAIKMQEMTADLKQLHNTLEDSLRDKIAQIHKYRDTNYQQKVKVFDELAKPNNQVNAMPRQLAGIRAGIELQHFEKAYESYPQMQWYEHLLEIVTSSVKRDGTVSHGEALIVEDVTKVLCDGYDYGKEAMKNTVFNLWLGDHQCMEVQEILKILLDKLEVSREEYASWCTVLGKDAKRDIMRHYDKFRKDHQFGGVTPSQTTPMMTGMRFMNHVSKSVAQAKEQELRPNKTTFAPKSPAESAAMVDSAKSLIQKTSPETMHASEVKMSTLMEHENPNIDFKKIVEEQKAYSQQHFDKPILKNPDQRLTKPPNPAKSTPAESS